MKNLTRLAIAVVVVLWISPVFSQQGLKPQDNAPMFTGTDQNGNKIDLQQRLQNGPVVLVFYRGQWCPYCNRQLKKLEDSMSLIAAKGASIIAVTPETAEGISQTVEKTKATFPILHDPGMAIMKQYDVAFAVDEKTIEKYKDYGIDFVRANGAENGANLPVPALYIINKEGKIIFSHFDKNYTRRVSVAEVLTYL